MKDVFLEIAGNNNLSEVETMFKKGSSRDAWDKWNYIIDREIEQEKRKRLWLSAIFSLFDIMIKGYLDQIMRVTFTPLGGNLISYFFFEKSTAKISMSSGFSEFRSVSMYWFPPPFSRSLNPLSFTFLTLGHSYLTSHRIFSLSGLPLLMWAAI